MPRVLEFNSIADLNPYRADWSRLLRQTPGGTFFQSFDWLEVYWRHFTADQQLRVMVVLENDSVSGIVPVAVRKIKTKFGSCRILTYPFDDWGSFYGPISPNPAATLTATLEHVQQTECDWDLIDLRWVDADGQDNGRTEHALTSAGLAFQTFAWEQTALIDLTADSWDDYLQSRSGKARQTYRRAEKRIAAEGDIQYVRYRPAGEAAGEGDPRWDLYDHCVAIAERSWQGSSTDGTTLSHAEVRDFLRDCHAAAARCGSLDLNLIYLSGQPAAFAYNYCYRGWVYSLRLGFDPGVSNKGLGRLVMGRMIRDSFDLGDQQIDMGIGTLDCKTYWLTSLAKSYRYVYYAPNSPRAQLMRLSNQVSGWFEDRFERSGFEESSTSDPARDTRRVDGTENSIHT